MTMLAEAANGHSDSFELDLEDAYRRLGSTGPTVETKPGGLGESGDPDKGFSQFLFHMSEELHSIRGIIMQGNIENQHVQLLLLGLLDIYRTYITADAATRQGRQKQEETLAKRAQSRMGNETPPKTADGEDLVEHLLHEWYTGSAREQIALVLESRHGLARAEEALDSYGSESEPPVKGRRWLREARARKEKALVAASDLPPAHAEYFWARQRETAIGMDRNMDQALDRPTRDFTDVRKRAADGIPLFKLAEDMPWVHQEIYNRVTVSVASGQRIKDLMTMYMRVWPWEQQAPPEERKLALAERNDVDSSTGARKSDEKKNEKKERRDKK